jgi:hypothetical protein
MFEIHEAVEGVSMKGSIKIKTIFEPYEHKIISRQFND